MTKPKEDWEKEFDKFPTHQVKIYTNVDGYKGPNPIIEERLDVDKKKLKSFIQKERRKAKEEGYKKGYGEASNLYAFGKIEERARKKAGREVLQRVEKEIVKYLGSAFFRPDYIVKDILDIIRKTEKELQEGGGV